MCECDVCIRFTAAAWQAECFEAMKAVCEKAEKSETAQKILLEMETGALEEAFGKENLSLVPGRAPL